MSFGGKQCDFQILLFPTYQQKYSTFPTNVNRVITLILSQSKSMTDNKFNILVKELWNSQLLYYYFFCRFVSAGRKT